MSVAMPSAMAQRCRAINCVSDPRGPWASIQILERLRDVLTAIRKAAVVPVPVWDWPGHALALEGEGKHAFLDGRGRDEARVADAEQHRLGQVERDEVERAHGAAAVSVGGTIDLRFLTARRAQMMPTS